MLSYGGNVVSVKGIVVNVGKVLKGRNEKSKIMDKMLEGRNKKSLM